MFSNSEGISHKRILGTIGFLCLIIYMFVNKNEVAVAAVEYVTIACVFGTVVEKFIGKKSTPVE